MGENASANANSAALRACKYSKHNSALSNQWQDSVCACTTKEQPPSSMGKYYFNCGK